MPQIVGQTPVCTLACAGPPEPALMTITPEERAHVIRLLRDSENEFLELTSGLTDAQWTWQAAPECLSLIHI